MASFFGEVVTGSYRFIDPEDPDYNDLRAPRQSWTADSEITREEKVLLVCEGDIAGSYVKLLLGDSPTVGYLSCENSKLEVRRGENFTAVLCSGQETGDIGAALLSLVRSDTCHVILLATRHISQLSGAEPDSEENIYSLTTKHWSQSLPCTPLPVPNFVTGLTSSVLTEGQLAGSKVALLVSYSDVLAVDSLTLEPFNLVHKIDAVSKCGIKPVKNISAELIKLKMRPCDESLYM